MTEILEPKFPLEVEGYTYLGRGPRAIPGAIGWRTGDDILYRCVSCGDFMQSSIRDDYSCSCGAMALDYGYGRFGSRFGDHNILVYRAIKKE